MGTSRELEIVKAIVEQALDVNPVGVAGDDVVNFSSLLLDSIFTLMSSDFTSVQRLFPLDPQNSKINLGNGSYINISVTSRVNLIDPSKIQRFEDYDSIAFDTSQFVNSISTLESDRYFKQQETIEKCVSMRENIENVLPGDDGRNAFFFALKKAGIDVDAFASPICYNYTELADFRDDCRSCKVGYCGAKEDSGFAMCKSSKDFAANYYGVSVNSIDPEIEVRVDSFVVGGQAVKNELVLIRTRNFEGNATKFDGCFVSKANKRPHVLSVFPKVAEDSVKVSYVRYSDISEPNVIDWCKVQTEAYLERLGLAQET